ncbi:Rapamycin-insensitive companion of mTOR AVO3 -like protein [Collichthys lucidus]|uniref:Rapamycin-insensitive companion of mTOR AVO3-like protein n=1 Tax=Collichthys lucidus TaxID=240159 RepID=A0A4U5V808_COLLU|nr:Rapamycin-insensitive companion of mTOR AVO3 -like protein [Collichthys lucidus]
MAVSSIRGRPSRSSRMRGRNDSGEENVPLDLFRGRSELRERLTALTFRRSIRTEHLCWRADPALTSAVLRCAISGFCG